jgi:hypothetical protein
MAPSERLGVASSFGSGSTSTTQDGSQLGASEGDAVTHPFVDQRVAGANVVGEAVEVDLERLAAVACPDLDLFSEPIDLLGPGWVVFSNVSWPDEQDVDVGSSVAVRAGGRPEQRGVDRRRAPRFKLRTESIEEADSEARHDLYCWPSQVLPVGPVEDCSSAFLGAYDALIDQSGQRSADPVGGAGAGKTVDLATGEWPGRPG